MSLLVSGRSAVRIRVARLQQLSHDELVDFFARAKPEDVGEIINVFRDIEGARIVATLGDISRRKATELLKAVGANASVPSKHGTFLVTGGASYRSEGGSGGWLGFPVGERKGVVTMRDGKYEVWVRPDSEPRAEPPAGSS